MYQIGKVKVTMPDKQILLPKGHKLEHSGDLSTAKELTDCIERVSLYTHLKNGFNNCKELIHYIDLLAQRLFKP